MMNRKKKNSAKKRCNCECSCKSKRPSRFAVCLLAASVACIFFRIRNKKRYYDKWKDYENCGI